jgi:DNA-binding Lrp family transcriptional regulator
MQTDALDEKILNELSVNSKATLRSLAGKLGVSFVTVMNRVKRLEKESIIEGYSAKINFEKLGYGTHVIVDVRISKGKLFELEKRIALIKNVYAVYDTTGESDALVIGKFKSTRSMDEFLKKIQPFDFVERTNTKLVLHTIKEGEIRL